MGLSAPKPPSIPLPPPAAYPSTLGSTQVALAGQTAAKKNELAEGMGFDNTVKTSPQGAMAPQTARTTLLGQ